MATSASVPGFLATDTKRSGVSEHVHHLLRLADALIHAATTPPPAGDPAVTGDSAVTVGPLGLDLGQLTDRECVQWAQDLERLATVQQTLGVHVAAELAHRTEAGRFAAAGVRNPTDMLMQSLKIGAGEARRRLELAHATLPTRNALTGQCAPVQQPVLGQAFFTGRIGEEQALIVAKFVNEATRLADNARISTQCRDDVEATLVTTGEKETPGFLRQVGNRLMSLLDPDGQKPSHADLIAKQGIVFRKPRRGLVGISGYLTLEQYEQLMTSIARFTNPNHHQTPNNSKTGSTSDSYGTEGNTNGYDGGGNTPTTSKKGNPAPPAGTAASDSGGVPVGEDTSRLWDDTGPLITTNNPNNPTNPAGTGGGGGFKDIDGVQVPSPGGMDELPGLDPIDPHSEDRVVKDERTYAQKLLDGLVECVKIAARTNTLPLNGGLKAQLIISTRQEDLNHHDGTGVGFGIYNGPVPLRLFDQSLCDANITHLTLGHGQEILNVGRTQRLFTTTQRKILYARDLGCTFPDCTAPPTWCEAHHVIPWQDGGESNISNAALLCGRHHTLIHHSNWTMTITYGTPYFTAPYLIDPHQKPRRNTYHHGQPKTHHPSHKNPNQN